ncbi:hypothetical protein [Terrabacter carboxydivorans]|uniref:WXG100 family type VII secretion target n=1 Tax=Terrabacter carboxydivorans TaxID=619730 RepID=A0ABP5YW67_9MICO
MAIYRKGADPDALDRSAELLAVYAREAASSRQAVSGVLGSLKGNWGGENLQSLISQWPAMEAQIDRFGTELGRLGDRLSRNAQAQRGVSGDGGSINSAAFLTAAMPTSGPGDKGGDSFWDKLLTQSNLAPDGSASFLAWPGLITANAMFGTSALASYMQRNHFGRWQPRGYMANGRYGYLPRPTGRWASAWSMNQARNWQANPYRAATVARWGTASKWAGRAGTVTSFATSAFGQWNRDSADPTMGTTERVTRSATAGAVTAAGSWAGAWAGAQGGALIGAAVGGPVGAVIGGAIGGFVGGGLGGVVGGWVSDQVVGPVGDAAEWAGDKIGDGFKAAGSFIGGLFD